MAKHNVYTIRAKLMEYEPEIWRTFEIDGKKPMSSLAYITMIMFEMQASHLFWLQNNQESYLLDDEEELHIKYHRFELSQEIAQGIFYSSREEILPIESTTIDEQEYNDGDGLTLYYDDWQVLLEIEDITNKEVSLKTLPRVLDGAGFGIIENSGGVSGFTEISEVLKQPNTVEYKHLMEWLDSDKMDLEQFNIDEMNIRMKKLLRVYRDIYENDKNISDATIKFLLRQEQGKGARGY